MEFISKKTLLAQISRLEKELALERERNAALQRELAEAKGKTSMDARLYQEMQGAMQTRLLDLDNRTAQFEQEKAQELAKIQSEKAQAQQAWEMEQLTARETLRRQCEDDRQRSRQELEQRIRAFQDAYSSQLVWLQERMDSVTKAALLAGEELFTAEAPDTVGIFRKELGEMEEMPIFEEPIPEAPIPAAKPEPVFYEPPRREKMELDAHVERVADLIDSFSRSREQ